MLGIKEPAQVENIDVKNYTRSILREGEETEKRELLACLKSKIELKDKVIRLAA